MSKKQEEIQISNFDKDQQETLEVDKTIDAPKEDSQDQPVNQDYKEKIVVNLEHNHYPIFKEIFEENETFFHFKKEEDEALYNWDLLWCDNVLTDLFNCIVYDSRENREAQKMAKSQPFSWNVEHPQEELFGLEPPKNEGLAPR